MNQFIICTNQYILYIYNHYQTVYTQFILNTNKYNLTGILVDYECIESNERSS